MLKATLLKVRHYRILMSQIQNKSEVLQESRTCHRLNTVSMFEKAFADAFTVFVMDSTILLCETEVLKV